MRVILIILMLNLGWIHPAHAQAAPNACTGAGCCCNAQAGGKWPDCAPGFECRGMPTPPYLQVCVKKGASPLTTLQLAPGQPAECKKSDAAEKEDKEDKKPPMAAKSCHGVGCCCQNQPLGQWPDCDPGFECRQATQKPYYKVCVGKGAPANTPLQIASSQPAQCFQRYQSGNKALPGKGHPFCENQPNEQAKQWCYQHMVNPPNTPPIK